MIDLHVLTVFPQFYRPHRRFGIVAKALEKGELSLTTWSLRRFTTDDYGQIDDRAYGGEFGMVMKPEPYFRGVEHIKETRGDAKVLMMDSGGRYFDSETSERLSNEERLIILTGRYEGIDQRVKDHLVNDLLSIGPFVTPGGDTPALAVISSVVRQIPGVVSNKTSVEKDSYKRGRLAPPHYTRPEKFRDYDVPEVLLSGDHQKIEEWRQEQAKKRTLENRPELLNEDQNTNSG